MAINFYNEKVEFVLKNKTKLKNWIKTIAQLENKLVGPLNFVFTNDEELLKKNIQFLKHTTFTDIITFDYSQNNKLSGDIFISIERVAQNAKKFNVVVEEELHRVIIHGVLHLCGYGDKTPALALKMRKKENWALKLYQL